MPKKNKKDDLDTETTFADMNLDSFRWYDPSKKNTGNEKKIRQKVSRREYWQMVRAGFLAVMPIVLVFILAMCGVGVLMYFWLR